MRRTFSLCLIFSLLNGPLPAAPARPRPAACDICGHACCCPDVCARKRAASHCVRPGAQCDLSPAADGTALRAEDFLHDRLSSRDDGAVRAASVENRGRRRAEQGPARAAPFADVPVPPPRLSA